jgi:hypothetical protein
MNTSATFYPSRQTQQPLVYRASTDKHPTKPMVQRLDLALQIATDTTPFQCLGSFEGSSCLPPLDQVTVASSQDCTDDVSSVSSCASYEKEEGDSRWHFAKSSAPRAIFSKYWGSQGGEAHRLNRPLPTEISTCVHTVILSQQETTLHESTAADYESSLRSREAEAKGGLTPKRRSIFANRYNSLSVPALNSASSRCYDLRKIQSETALRPSKSCLRTSRRYSGVNRRYESTADLSESSVRFSDKVEITLFRKPVERYAQEGWSEHFA